MIRLLPIRSLLAVPALLATTFCAPAIAGSSQRDAERAAARTAGYEGVKAYESGDMTVAVERLGRAFDVVKIPTLGLWYARALARSGKLVDASERYGEVIRLEVTEGKLKEQKQAQAEAASELEALKPRIPTLTLTAPGATDDCQLSLDGGTISTTLLALATPINPGTHRVQATQSGEIVEETFSIAEGEKKTIALRFSNTKNMGLGPKQPTPSSDPSADPTNSGDNLRTTSNPRSTPSIQRTAGWVVLGVGGAATVVGAVTGILALMKRDQLDSDGNCNGTVCNTNESAHVDSYRQMRTISTIGFVAGAVGVGVGTTLLLTTPKPKAPELRAWLGIGSVGMGGNF